VEVMSSLSQCNSMLLNFYWNVLDLRGCHLLQVLMRIESDEHIFKFLKAKFGYGLGRYVSYALYLSHCYRQKVALLFVSG